MKNKLRNKQMGEETNKSLTNELMNEWTNGQIH